MIRGNLTALALALGLACDDPAPARPPAAVVPLAGLQAAYQAGPELPFATGLSRVFPDGFLPSDFFASPDEIRVGPLYTRGEQTAQMTTDLWVNFPLVWVQPLYIFVSDWNAETPERHRVDIPWVFAVGPESPFWSPFHRVTYVKVPADTGPDRYRSVRAIFQDQLPLFPGPTRLVTVLPSATVRPEEGAAALLPGLREPGRVGRPQLRSGWSDGDGRELFGLDFGENRFRYNERDVVVEEPLFVFFGRDEGGRWSPFNTIPRIGGTGPLHGGSPPLAPGDRPLFGSLWRLHAVHLPDTARVFVPPQRRLEWETRNGGAGLGPPAIEPPPGLTATPAQLDEHAFKVLLDSACLARHAAEADLTLCPWLDSQENLERHLGHALYPSEVLIAGPYLSFGGTAVPTPTP